MGLLKKQDYEPHEKMTYWQTGRLFMLTCAGFLVDGYINGVIGLITTMLGYLYYPSQKNTLPANLSDAVSGILTAGILTGQLTFGTIADKIGRRKVYGKELLITIFGTIMCSVVPPHMSSGSVMAWLVVFRFVTGFGIGGDYPLSGAIASERKSTKWRGAFIAGVFSAYSWGGLFSAIVLLVLLAIYKNPLQTGVYDLQYVWRFLLALGTVPALFLIYARLTLRETLGFKKYVENNRQQKQTWKQSVANMKEYYSDWKHLRTLLAIGLSWFFFDIATYGLSLNKGTVLQLVGYGSGSTTWEKFQNIAVGNMIVSTVSFGASFVAIPLIDRIGRVNLQFYCSISACILYSIWTGMYDRLNNGSGFIILYVFSSFFMTLGPNTTTFILASEMFPTRVRAMSAGICGAFGKVGAIISGFAFARVQEEIGFTGLLTLFSVCLGVVALLSSVIPETAGLTLDEIELDMHYERKNALLSWNYLRKDEDQDVEYASQTPSPEVTATVLKEGDKSRINIKTFG